MTTSLKAAPNSNFFECDVNFQAAIAARAPDSLNRWRDALSSFGAWTATEAEREADYTDRFAPPLLEPYDGAGQLVNRIRLNPMWEETAREAYRRGMVGLNYGKDPAPFLITFAMGYLLSQSNVSLHCPVTMTGAVAYVIDRFAPRVARERYLNELIRRDGKALTGGTWATEIHGGSDVGSTATVATPLQGRSGEVRLNGLKWFASNANGGVALATARPEGAESGSAGLGLYLVPTHLDDGAPNPMRLRRLKEKLGTRGVPTGEIDLADTWALEIAPPPRGFKLMMEALEFSRIHNAMASAAVQRRAFMESLAYASRRTAFGEIVVRYPMVQDEILKILAPLEASVNLACEAAHAFDATVGLDIDDESEARLWLRLATAFAKYLTAEDAVAAARRAIEIIGGNGYTADFVTPRLLRDAQALTVWEGPANIQALELLRMLGNRYTGADLLLQRLDEALQSADGDALARASGADLLTMLARAVDDCRDAIAFVQARKDEALRHARRLIGLLSEVFAAALLLKEAGPLLKGGDARKALVARLFIEERIAPPKRRGILPQRDWPHRHFEALVGYRPVSSREIKR